MKLRTTGSASFILEHKYDTLPIRNVQLKFCSMLLGVHKSAVNNAVRAELGLFLLCNCLFEVVCHYLVTCARINASRGPISPFTHQ